MIWATALDPTTNDLPSTQLFQPDRVVHLPHKWNSSSVRWRSEKASSTEQASLVSSQRCYRMTPLFTFYGLSFFLLIDSDASDLTNGTDQNCSRCHILIICGNFAGLNNPDSRSLSDVVLFPVLCRWPSKIEVDNSTLSQRFKAQWSGKSQWFCEMRGQFLSEYSDFRG
jgi:hypothetical protein